MSSTKPKKTVVGRLLQRPPKDKPYQRDHYERGYGKNVVHQADLLFMPADGPFKYLLVVVDGGSRLVEAEPLKSKEASHVLDGFKAIYKRGALNVPLNLQVDAGKEFRGSVERFFQTNDTHIRVGKVGRHQQQALVESRNKTIAQALFKRMTEEEYITGQPNSEWVDYLPRVIKAINKRIEETPTPKPKKRKEHPPEVLLDTGTKVRVALDAPMESVKFGKLPGKFRATDIRFHPIERTIMAVQIGESGPARYIVSLAEDATKPDNTVSYTRNQLQVVGEEDYPDAKDILLNDKKQETFIAQKILERKRIKRQVHYLVKYRGHKDPVYQPLSELIKNSHTRALIEEFTKTPHP